MGQRRNELTPHASPQHAWGARLRMFRDQARPPVSCAQLGERIYQRHYAFRDRSYIARIERGACPIPPEFPLYCDEALGTGRELTTLYQATVAAPSDAHVESPQTHVDNTVTAVALRPAELASWAGEEDVVVPARTTDGEVVVVAISRRNFIASVGSGVVGLAALGDVNAIASAASGKDVDYAAHFEKMRLALIDSDNLFGSIRVLPTVKEQIMVMRQLRTSGQVADIAPHMRSQAQYAEFAGWLLQDARQLDESQRWTDQALTWSYAARDPSLTAFILARKAQLAGDAGDGADAVDVAAAAADLAGHGRLAAIAETFGAHGHALLGDYDRAQRAYDRAEAHLTAACEPTPWGEWLDPAYIEISRARSLSTLGRHAAAADTFDRTLDRLPSAFHRDRGVYLARAATAHARNHEVEQACTLGVSAARIGSDTGSGRIASELAVLRAALRQWHTDARVSELDETLETIVAGLKEPSL